MTSPGPKTGRGPQVERLKNRSPLSYWTSIRPVRKIWRSCRGLGPSWRDASWLSAESTGRFAGSRICWRFVASATRNGARFVGESWRVRSREPGTMAARASRRGKRAVVNSERRVAKRTRIWWPSVVSNTAQQRCEVLPPTPVIPVCGRGYLRVNFGLPIADFRQSAAGHDPDMDRERNQ